MTCGGGEEGRYEGGSVASRALAFWTICSYDQYSGSREGSQQCDISDPILPSAVTNVSRSEGQRMSRTVTEHIRMQQRKHDEWTGAQRSALLARGPGPDLGLVYAHSATIPYSSASYGPTNRYTSFGYWRIQTPQSPFVSAMRKPLSPTDSYRWEAP
eukprot:3252594-Rhodomonas_salina.4